MKILMTGGTGFLGRRTVERLASEHEVRLLVRPTSSRDRFPESVEFAEGDVTDAESLVRASADRDAILHAAALVKILAPGADFDRINIGGLDNVLAAAKKNNVGKIVYVSSFMALGPTENGPDGMLDETAPVTDRSWINHYERTKTLSDRAARRAIADGVPMNVVYPGVIYGPGELTEGNIAIRHIIDLAYKRLPALLGKADRVWNYSFVEDVAQGIVQTLETAPDGGRYVLAGDNITQGKFYATVDKVCGIKTPKMRMPDFMAKASGAMMKGFAQLTGTTPKLTPDLVEVYRHDWALSSKTAEDQIGYRWRSFEQGLTETFEWLKTTGEWPAKLLRKNP